MSLNYDDGRKNFLTKAYPVFNENPILNFHFDTLKKVIEPDSFNVKKLVLMAFYISVLCASIFMFIVLQNYSIFLAWGTASLLSTSFLVMTQISNRFKTLAQNW